jgi:hypothetical protein
VAHEVRNIGQQPALSIIIPTLDMAGELFAACVKSIAEHTLVAHEVIVMDNNDAPQGYVPPVNAACRAARGRYVCVLNDDLKVQDGWWEPLQRELDAGADVVCPWCINGNADFAEHHNAWAVACKREMLSYWPDGEYGLYDSRFKVYWADRDLFERCRANGNPIRLVEDSRVWHQFNATVARPELGSIFGDWITRDREEFFAKWPQLAAEQRYRLLARTGRPTMELVFSIDGSPYQRWQAELQEWSFRRAGFEGRVTASTDTFTAQARAEGLPQYLGGNKPYALMRHAERTDLADIVLVTDPDCFFLYGFECVPELGRPWAQRSIVVYPTLEENAKWLRPLGGSPENMQQIGCIFAYRRDDFVRMANEYWDATRDIWTWPDAWQHFEWMTDMYAYLLAEQRAGLRHVPVELCLTNLEGRSGLPMVHMAYENNSTNGHPWRFHKWELRPWNRIPDPPEVDPGVDPATREFVGLYNEYAQQQQYAEIPR